MTITIVKLEKAVVVQVVGTIQDLREEGDEIFGHEGFTLYVWNDQLELFRDHIGLPSYPNSDTAVEYRPKCMSFDSNKNRDEWISQCTNCLKAWKESRRGAVVVPSDRWTMEVE